MTRLATSTSLAPEIALDLARLADALRIADRGFIGFALFGTFPARDAMIGEIEMRLAGEVEIRRVELTPDEPYLYERLELDQPSAISHQPSARHIAYFAYGFEGISDEARAQAFGALQIQREAIGRLEVPVVLWMVEGNLIDLARRAPDFFVWRAGLYDFRSPDRAHAEEFGRAMRQMLDVYSPSMVPPEELRKRVRLFEELLARRQAEPEPHLGGIAGLHHGLGLLHYQLKGWDAALTHYQQARETYERLDDTASLAAMLNNIGEVLRHKGERDAALAHFQRARATYERLGDDARLAGTINNIGSIFGEKGDWDTALAYFQQARETFERLDDATSLAMTLGNIGNIFGDKGEWDAALEHYRLARATYERLGDTAGLAMTLNNIGNIFGKKGEWDAALAHFKQAREIRQRLGDAAGLATTLNNIGSIFNKKGEWDAALAHFKQARATYERLDDDAGLAMTLNNIGSIYANKGERDAALAHYQQARATYERLGDTAGLAMTLWNIGLVYEDQERISDALPILEQAVELERRIGHPAAEKAATYLASLRQRQ